MQKEVTTKRSSNLVAAAVSAVSVLMILGHVSGQVWTILLCPERSGYAAKQTRLPSGLLSRVRLRGAAGPAASNDCEIVHRLIVR